MIEPNKPTMPRYSTRLFCFTKYSSPTLPIPYRIEPVKHNTSPNTRLESVKLIDQMEVQIKLNFQNIQITVTSFTVSSFVLNHVANL